jgi:hypothetical protein
LLFLSINSPAGLVCRRLGPCDKRCRRNVLLYWERHGPRSGRLTTNLIKLAN